ncbi:MULTISPECIES: restriction endonuclease subunit S [unclassified Imperialibacter]|uniref:restriction endonuclease subunit S n=1 Tax=unclassified Imperialibacter TaxID=2629706 RepID=UPI001252DD70|nr:MULTISPECIES: restriction endonuclease subunit S [unclassified Imperialibacter]CAD5248186.1 Restriction modification system DNA specificity domain protein [Imperialibacter sp. 75]CAD5248311.1 Restriction modification system DNA specificity domain protein [Imperialibacter sp. 89]VVS97554.1 Restriction modification system DNA specificity domain protein [Imperialibacter sp. EC-SDR9]
MTLVKIGDVCNFQGGTQPPKNEWKSEPVPGYVRMLQIRDFTQGKDKHIEFVKDGKKLNKCKADDILIGRYGASVGKILTGLEGAYNVAIIKTVPDESKIHKRYLYYFLLNPRFKNFITNIGGRAAQQGFNKEDISDYRLFLPPLPDQLHIADLLSKAENLIAQRKESIRLLNEYLKSTFFNFFDNPVTNRNSYKEVKLGDLTTFLTSGGRGWGKYYSKTGERFIRSLDVQMNNIFFEDAAFVIPPDNQEANRTKVEPFDVLLTITGSKIGRVAMVPENFGTAYISQHVALIRTNGINPLYLSYYLSDINCGQYLIKKSFYGQTKPGLNFKQIESFDILVPPIELQTQFAQIVKKTEALKIQYQQSLQELEHLYGSLSQKAFRGELVAKETA